MFYALYLWLFDRIVCCVFLEWNIVIKIVLPLQANVALYRLFVQNVSPKSSKMWTYFSNATLKRLKFNFEIFFFCLAIGRSIFLELSTDLF